MADRRVIYSMTVSLDGFIAGPAGEIDWSAPDEELFRFLTEQTRELGVHLCGRRLYETMVYWETADQDAQAGRAALGDPAATAITHEFAHIWQQLPKIVFSTTLESVEGQHDAVTRRPRR